MKIIFTLGNVSYGGTRRLLGPVNNLKNSYRHIGTGKPKLLSKRDSHSTLKIYISRRSAIRNSKLLAVEL